MSQRGSVEKMRDYLKRIDAESNDVRTYSSILNKLFDEDDRIWNDRIAFYHEIHHTTK